MAKLDPIYPDHYKLSGDKTYEVIEVMERWLTRREFIGAMKFQIFKYNARALGKGIEDENYQKSQWYNNRLVDYLARHPKVRKTV
jgi:hypothetical protein